MDLDPGILLLLLWGLLSIFGGLAKKRQQGQRQQRPPVARQPPGARRKPQTFDDLLADMREQLEGAKEAEAARREGLARPGPVSRPRQPLPSAEEVEERESLEIEPVIVSSEVPARIEEREIVDSDLEAQQLLAARLREAEEHNRAWRLEDHRKFDVRIRAVAPQPRQPATHAVDLKRAVIWREVLGKPVSLRDSVGGR